MYTTRLQNGYKPPPKNVKSTKKYFHKEKIPAYKLSYPSSKKVKPEYIPSVVYTEDKIKDIALFAAIHSCSIGSGMMMLMIIDSIHQEE